MADKAEELDLYIDNFLKQEEMEEDDFDFFDYLLTLAFFEATIFASSLQSSIERLQFEGLTDSQVKTRINTQYRNKTGAFAVLFNATEDIVRYGIRENGRIGMMAVFSQVFGDDSIYRWIVA